MQRLDLAHAGERDMLVLLAEMQHGRRLGFKSFSPTMPPP